MPLALLCISYMEKNGKARDQGHLPPEPRPSSLRGPEREHGFLNIPVPKEAKAQIPKAKEVGLSSP